MKKKNNSKKKEKKEQEELEEGIIEDELENTAKEIKKETSIEEERISNFILPTETKAPVLEKIANEETPISIQKEFETEKEPEKILKYTTNEPKYISRREVQTEQEERNYETPMSLELMERGTFENQQDFFVQQRSAWEQSKEIGEVPEHIKTIRTGKQTLPFEKEQKKYEIR